MKLLTFAAAVALSAAVAAPASAAIFVNGSFESPVVGGVIPGWSTAGSGSVDIVTTAQPSYGSPFTATDGRVFALLTAGSADDYVTLAQTFTLTGNAIISFDAAFLAFDETSNQDGPDGLGYNDDGYVKIYDQSTQTIVFSSDVNAVGDYGHTDWTHLSQLLGAGTYTLEAGVRNVGDIPSPDFDPTYSSKLVVDNVTAADAPAGPVPEPAAWALMILGFGATGAALRGRRSAQPRTA